MDVVEEIVDDVCVVRVSGRLDYEAADAFREILEGIRDSGAGPVVLDLTKVSLLGSACLGELINFRKQVGRNRKVALSGLSRPIRRLVKLSSLDALFAIGTTEQDALARVTAQET